MAQSPRRPSNPDHTAAGNAVTDLILDTFRLNGRLIAAGDAVVRELGLTSARWQVLGAVAHAHAPANVAQIARGMGLRRQGIQRVVDVLVSNGLLAYADNPNHQRWKHVVLTPKGKSVFRKSLKLQAQWTNALGAGLDVRDLAEADEVIRKLHRRLSER